MLYGWLVLGTLGSGFDLALALALGGAAGSIAGRILDLTWLPILSRDSRGRGADLLTGGLAAGAVLC